MTSDLGFALIGCGDIGKRNAESIAGARGARLARVVDTNPQAAASLGAAFDVPASASLEEALADASVQAVFVATPHDLHADMVVASARAGRHVVVEKPLATTAAAARESVDACSDAGVHFSVCHPRRYEEKVACARSLVERGLVGRVLFTTTRFFKDKGDDYWTRAGWRASRERSGGGVLLMNLVHDLDALQEITGSTVAEATALCGTLAGGIEVEDTAAVSLRYDSGALGTMAACSAVPGPKVFEDAVWGTEGRLAVGKREVRLFTTRASDLAPPGEWTTFSFAEDRTSKVRFVEEFAASVREGRPPPVPASYGLHLLSLILDAYAETTR